MSVDFHINVRADVRAASEAEALGVLTTWVRGALSDGDAEGFVVNVEQIHPSPHDCEAHPTDAHPVCVDVPVSASGTEDRAALEARAVRWVTQRLGAALPPGLISSVDVAAH